MQFPEFLYRLTPRDEQVTPLELVTYRSSIAAVGTTVTTTAYVVPLGKILLLNTNTVETNSTGGVITCNEVRTEMYLDATIPVVLTSMMNPTAGAAELNLTGFNGACVPEGWSVRAVGTFAAAGAGGNNVIHCLSGILIPRGNFAI